MKRRLLMLCLFLFITTVQVLAQKTVTGKVTDDEANPLPGVSVQVKGTNAGVTTDSDGNYSIKVNKGQTLVISFKGTVTEERIVGNSSHLNFYLKRAAAALDQVVVVGYGSQRKADLTGAVATIDVQKAVGSRPVPDLARDLQGSSPGLLITTSSGDLGQAPEIHLRGITGSVNAEATPLILLDNVPIPDMNMVNPEDIESISVLKDAASASIYGARASWGVILLTSKKGKKGRIHVSYNNNFAWSSPMNTPKNVVILAA